MVLTLLKCLDRLTFNWNIISVMFLLRSPTALWVRGSCSRRRVRASPAVWHPGQSTSHIRVLDIKWKHSGSVRRWLLAEQWRLNKPTNRQQREEKLAWRHISVRSRVSHLWRKHQAVQCHSNRSDQYRHTYSSHCSIFDFLLLLCNRHMKWWISYHLLPPHV